ncbi:MAG: adenosylcobinamide-GDP ribazoletransferase [Candidatus Omnitrophica bacterium]|nr:adenosylcobinamide-GDP ribazoletransferase [Candidatus Omnitrophota bacterium]
MKKLLLALQFLTILPIRTNVRFKEEDFKSVCAFFPLAGACIGLILAPLTFVMEPLPHLAMVASVLAVYIVMTGALHLDGLADTCDGFFSGKSKEQILEIMKDSRIGTFGAVGVCMALILKFAFIASFPKELLWKMFILVPVFSRWVQAMVCSHCMYARSDGKAKLFFKYANVKDTAMGAASSLLFIFILFGLKGIFVFLAALFPVALLIKFLEKKIDGMTGDTVGAVSEIAELSILFYGLILLK